MAESFGCSPADLSEEQVRRYVIEKRKTLALGSMRPLVGALKFLYRVTLPRDWKTLKAIRLPKSQTIPKVLAPEACWQIIDACQKTYLRAAMQLAFTCGLRSIDVRQLQVQDIDSETLTLHIRHSKGLRERRVPLPESTLEVLRGAWSEHRHCKWIFPSRQRLKEIQTADRPLSPRSLQRGTEKVLESLGWSEKGIVFHTLRHSYATAMLDEGANVIVLSEYMGHKNLQATEVYLHLTKEGDAKARRIVNRIFRGTDSSVSGVQVSGVQGSGVQ